MQYSSGVTKCIINVRDAVKTFYVCADTELKPNANYYILLLVHDQIIALTNKFSKTCVIPLTGQTAYKLDLFTNQVTFPFCDLLPSYQQIEFIGVNYRDANDYDIDVFSEIFYEIDSNYVSIKSGWQEIMLRYHESDLVNKHRKNIGDCISKLYDKIIDEPADNVLRICNGMMGVGYTVILPWGDHDPRLEVDHHISFDNSEVDQCISFVKNQPSSSTENSYASCGQRLSAVDCSKGTGQRLSAVDCSKGTGQRLSAVDCSKGTGQRLSAVDCSKGTGQRLSAVDCSKGTGQHLSAVDCSKGTGQHLSAVDCSKGTGQHLSAVDCSKGTGQIVYKPRKITT